MDIINNLLTDTFSYRIYKSFSSINTIEVPGLLSAGNGAIELTEVTGKCSSSIVKINIANKSACYKGIQLSPKLIGNIVEDQQSEYAGKSSKLAWLGYDLIDKYFITIFNRNDGYYKVIYWVPTSDKNYKPISDFDMYENKQLEGRFIELINNGRSK